MVSVTTRRWRRRGPQRGEAITTEGGVPVEDTDNSLSVGPRGPA
jgi:hypothetical protein